MARELPDTLIRMQQDLKRAQKKKPCEFMEEQTEKPG